MLSCLAQEKGRQAKQVRHKWKGIQAHFLEERTLCETRLDVPDFKQPQAKWTAMLAASQSFPEIGSRRWPAPWQVKNERARNVGCPCEWSPPIRRSHIFLRPSPRRSGYQGPLRFSNQLGRRVAMRYSSWSYDTSELLFASPRGIADGANMKG